jgi:hypothetical protein
MRDLTKDVFGGGDGTGVAVVAGKGVFHGAPADSVVGEEGGHTLREGLGSLGELATTDDFKQPEIPLFLTGDEVMNQHRATGGDGFVDGGSAGLADDEVVAV